jgi:transcriptional regulator GlxA family with amidase domain
MALHHVGIVCFAGIQPLDVVGPHEVFAGASQALTALDGYVVHLLAAEPGTIRGSSGLAIVADRPLPRRPAFDTLVVPGGDGVDTALEDRALVAWIRRAGAGSRRVASVCSGSLLLAEAGLLDGRRATTHWRRAQQFAERYPAVTVDADPIFIHDGKMWTSAGVTSGIDLALALVEADHGSDLAQRVARHLVMFLRRPGGQSQFATPVWTRRAEHDAVREAQELIDVTPDGDHRVETLARLVGMSPRNFARVFAAQTGETPARYVERVRVDHARLILELETCGVVAVARRCGFGSAETLRRAFVRRVGVAPDDYRKRFA